MKTVLTPAEILKHPIAQEYAAACKAIQEHYKPDTVEPLPIVKRYNKAIKAYRGLCDRYGYRMPLPHYPYFHDSGETWKYLDTIIDGKFPSLRFIKHIPNLKWKYRRSAKNETRLLRSA